MQEGRSPSRKKKSPPEASRNVEQRLRAEEELRQGGVRIVEQPVRKQLCYLFDKIRRHPRRFTESRFEGLLQLQQKIMALESLCGPLEINVRRARNSYK